MMIGQIAKLYCCFGITCSFSLLNVRRFSPSRSISSSKKDTKSRYVVFVLLFSFISKVHKIDDYYSESHSRTVSESSHDERKKKYKRANSYLPYSNHHRDPNHTESIYLQDDNPMRRGPVGSILQDNIVMDMMNHDSFYLEPTEMKRQNTNSALIETLPPVKKKSWWTKCGISGKKLVFAVFIFIAVVAVIWYFVWPRTPTLQFVDVRLLNDTIANYTTTSMVASWQVDFRVLNDENWIPTNIQNLAINVVEQTTGVTFGSGNSGALRLDGRSSDRIITVPIDVNFVKSATDPTLKTLLYACGTINQDLSSATPKQTLNVQFNILYYIAGIVWHPSASVSPQTYFQCP